MQKRLWLGCLLGLLLALPTAAETAPVLSWTEDPETSVTAVWFGDAEQAVMQVVSASEYDRSGIRAAVSFPAQRTETDGTVHWEVTAEGLAADTEYVYRVVSEEACEKVHRFRTAGGADTVTFAFLGDPQPDNSADSDYAAWSRLTENVYSSHPELDFALLSGDIVNSGISAAQFEAFLQAASPVFRSVPLFSAAGNHESNFPSGKPELFLELFAFPKNGPEGFQEEFYSFDCGSVHVTVLNSWIFSGEQKLTAAEEAQIADWIRFDIASSAADWQIVVTHLPVYPVHSDRSADRMSQAWREILEEYGVDLILVGHQHVYARSEPLYRGKPDVDNGLVSIMGVSGSKFYSSADETHSACTVYHTAVCTVISADADGLTVQTVDEAGNEVDFAVLTARSGKQTRLSYMQRLWKAAGCPEPKGVSPFTDTDDPAAIWGYEAGLFFGYGGGISGADDLITDWQKALISERMEARA